LLYCWLTITSTFEQMSTKFGTAVAKLITNTYKLPTYNSAQNTAASDIKF